MRREILRINQTAFARHVGVSVRTVKRWEASFIAPNREKAEKIAALANLASDLFYPDDVVEPDPVLEVRQLLEAQEETLITVSERMVATLAEMERQLARQTDLLQAIGEKVAAMDPADDGPKPRRVRRKKP